MSKIRDKGSYGDARLPVSQKYLIPIRRGWMLWIGLAAGLAAALLAVLDFSVHDAGFLSNGPLSSSHASLESDCAACHTAFSATPDQNCADCHEAYGDELGAYSFATHYLYRTGDFQRVIPSEHELPCAACHPEHNGRQGAITETPDDRCLTCHDISSFNRAHPTFAAVAEPDDASLSFAHTHHVREVMKRESWEDLEKACLFCHNPEQDGKTFQAIDFDRHCDACHLTASVSVPRLPVDRPDAPGALTLEEIQKRREPGSLWSFYVNPNEFRKVGSRVSKAPVHHRDPWVMENLRHFRKILFPDAGLADLLGASPDAPPRRQRALYREAIQTLRGYALELRARPEPEIQKDLQRIEEALANLEQGLEDPFLALDETEFPLSLQDAPELPPDQVEAIEALVADLTEPCRTCHVVENATIARVQANQGAFHAAEFNHRAHILQRRCLDCHNRIPIRELLAETEPIPAAVDHAGIQNLPDIETCQPCHNPEQSANRCITCHQFHPDRSKRAKLLLYHD